MIAAAHAKSTDPRRLHQARARAANGTGDDLDRKGRLADARMRHPYHAP
jgi:hypothetical protein